MYAPAPEILRLLYVALTRAETELFVPMSIARRFGIADELESTESGARKSTPEVPEEPLKPLIVEPKPWPESRYTYDHSRVPSMVPIPEVRNQPAEARESRWDRWGVWLKVLIGVVASLALLSHKGYIDW